ncbi:MAG: acyltransferase family protein [Candidatus Thiodiazotropha sp.]
MHERIDLVDVAKGMSILFVAFHHSALSSMCTDVSHAMGLFRMPLFFFLSGVFFSTVRSPMTFFIHKTDALLKPYFVTTGFLLITTILLWPDAAFKETLGIFYATGSTIRWTPMWFLPHLWALFMGSYLMVRLLCLDQRSSWFRITFIICLIVLGVICQDLFRDTSFKLFGHEYKLPGLPFSVDVIFISMTFFLSGHFLNRQVKSFIPNSALLVMAVGIFFAIVVFTQARVDMNLRIYQEPVLATMAATSGIYLMMSCAYYLSLYPWSKGFFKAFGSASLFILIFHDFIGQKTQTLLDQLLSTEWILLTAIVSFWLSVTLPLLVKFIFSKSRFLSLLYFPLSLHKRERNQIEQPVPVGKIP